MTWINELYEELAAIVALLPHALWTYYSLSIPDFWNTIIFSAIIALFVYFGVRFIGKWWFKRYELSFGQHIGALFATALTALFSVIWVAADFLVGGLSAVLLLWQATLNLNPAWEGSAQVAGYEAVARTGKEDLRTHPHPNQGGRFTPLMHSESRLAYASAVMDLAASNFSSFNPPLGRLLDATSGLDTPASEVKSMTDDFFATGETLIPVNKTVQMTADVLRREFESRSDSIVDVARWTSALLPLTAWIVLLSFVGRKSAGVMRGKIGHV
jgi:hypothetical protein